MATEKEKPTDRHGKVNFSAKYANSVSKEAFIKQHQHLAGDVDLGAEYDKLTAKEPKKPAEEAKSKN